MDSPVGFQENEAQYDVLNQCRRCGIKAGKYENKMTGESTGIFLLADARGFKICNKCKELGYYIGKKKMTKAARKLHKKMKQDLREMVGLPHVTFDSKGRKVV